MISRTLLSALRGSALFAAALALSACGNDNSQVLDDKEHEEAAILEVKGTLQHHLDDLAAAAAALQAAAPEADADGWSAADDAAAVDAMKAEWKKARIAYESIEGAIAVLFPGLDVSTDARYDAFIEVAPDDDLFDGQGVTGMHAIERILWADAIPPHVVAFESGLAGYTPAAFPATEAQAKAFKTALCERLVTDTIKMRDDFEAMALDAPAAYRGVIGSMAEQIEKLDKAATGEEESRYANFTLADMRANIAAGVATYGAFHDWIVAKGGSDVDDAIAAGFGRLQAGYDALPGDSLPPVPEGWSSASPSKEDLATPFGELFVLISGEADPDTKGTLVSAMNESADLLGIDPL